MDAEHNRIYGEAKVLAAEIERSNVMHLHGMPNKAKS